MKAPSSLRSARAFTLIELLVVISILLVLAGLVFGAGQSALNKAKKVEAAAVIQTIRQGIGLYQSEYGKLPQFQATAAKADQEINSVADQDAFKILITTLMGSNLTTIGSGTNPRGVAFCEFKAKYFKNGDPGTGLLYTPWKNGTFPYYVALDYDYDNQIPYRSGTVNARQLPSKFDTDVNGSSAVWCQGPARTLEGMTAIDLVSSWK
jgi:prepilin-type N-terminal cleavage/methylation domain-containing protein